MSFYLGHILNEIKTTTKTNHHRTMQKELQIFAPSNNNKEIFFVADVDFTESFDAVEVTNVTITKWVGDDEAEVTEADKALVQSVVDEDAGSLFSWNQFVWDLR